MFEALHSNMFFSCVLRNFALITVLRWMFEQLYVDINVSTDVESHFEITSV